MTAPTHGQVRHFEVCEDGGVLDVQVSLVVVPYLRAGQRLLADPVSTQFTPCRHAAFTYAYRNSSMVFKKFLIIIIIFF